MFYIFKKNKKWADWRRAEADDIKALHAFLLTHEHYSVPLTSRLSDEWGNPDTGLLNRNTVFIEEREGRIVSAVMLSPEGIICPVFTNKSSLQPLFYVLNGSAYSKKGYLTLMGLKENIISLELYFKNKNRFTVDYDFMSAESSTLPSRINNYLEKKDQLFISRLKIRRATTAELDLLMPLRSAYEIEEVVLNPSNFNEKACRNRFIRTISQEAVFFAETGGLPAGTCCISASGFRWGQIGGVYTKPEYRARGLSARLMAATAEYAEKKGKDLMLFVKKDNASALRLYSNCGFVKTGDYRISYLESR